MRRLGGWALALLLMGACGDDEGVTVAEPGPTTEAAVLADAVTADDIPVAHTPEGGWTGAMPDPVLAGCTQPLVDGAPDLRGLWEVVEVETAAGPAPTHPALGLVQRVEQCGDRIVVTASGVIHDMRADGTEANGVNDVAQADKTTPITVVATYEDGVHVLRPVGLDVEVTRWREGDQMLWGYVGFTARSDRIGGPDDPHPATEETS